MVVYLYKKGRQTMKNIITTIAIMFLCLPVKAQGITYQNFGIRLESILDSNNIFYVGVLDRKLLIEGKKAYIRKDVKFLDSFEKTYNNDEFKTKLDTTNLIMKESELLDGKLMTESFTQVSKMFSNRDYVVGYKYFDTPNSKTFIKILVYEIFVKESVRQLYTFSLGQTNQGLWVPIWNY